MTSISDPIKAWLEPAKISPTITSLSCERSQSSIMTDVKTTERTGKVAPSHISGYTSSDSQSNPKQTPIEKVPSDWTGDVIATIHSILVYSVGTKQCGLPVRHNQVYIVIFLFKYQVQSWCFCVIIIGMRNNHQLSGMFLNDVHVFVAVKTKSIV